MIHVPTYEVLCNGCQHVIASAPSLAEAREVEREGRDCIKVADEVYCCEECAENAKRAGTDGYSFCETIFASGATPWHIRKLTDNGPKFSGGADSPTLCGKTMEFGGWDVNVPMIEHHLRHACHVCVEAMRKAKP